MFMQMANSKKSRETIWIYNRAHCDLKKSETAKTRHPSVQIHHKGNRTSPEVDFSRDAVNQTSI